MLRSLEHPKADPRSLNELFGFVARCAAESSAHRMDYQVLRSQAIQLAGGMSEAPRLIELAEFCGLFQATEVDHEGMKVTAYVIHQDLELFHLKLSAEQDWENQRKRDTRDPDQYGPARQRDGDACRYCGKTVSWRDRSSNRAATYDHSVPGQQGNLVVCCKGCNSKRRNDPDSVWKLLEEPAKPLYGPETKKILADLGIHVELSYPDPSVVIPPTVQNGAPSAASGPQSSGQTPAVETPQQGPAPAETSAPEAAGPGAPEVAADAQQQVEAPTQDDAPSAAAGQQQVERSDDSQASEAAAGLDGEASPKPRSDPGHEGPGPRFVGTGRDGSGRAGPGEGLAGPGLVGSGRAGSGRGLDGDRAGCGAPREPQDHRPKAKRRRGKRGGKR